MNPLPPLKEEKFEEFYKRIPQPKANIKWEIDNYTRYLMRLKMESDKSFKRCFMPAYDITKLFHERCWKKAHGIIRSHFVIMVRGLVGVDTGTGSLKTSTSIELMKLYDTNATVEHIGWSNDELLEKVQNIINTTEENPHTVFMRDETPESLKHRSNVEFTTLREAIRQRQISFILVKPEMESLHAATFVLEPIYHTSDLKWVKHAVFVPDVGYIGSITIQIHLNNPIWKAYQPYKEKYLKQVVNRQTNQLHHTEIAQKFMQTPQFKKCVVRGKLNKLRARKYLREVYPNLTNEEARYVHDSLLELCEGLTTEELEKMTEAPV
jgi:hypothetical protein